MNVTPEKHSPNKSNEGRHMRGENWKEYCDELYNNDINVDEIAPNELKQRTDRSKEE